MKKKFQNKTGFSAIITIVILSIAGLIMAYSAVLLGLGELEMGYDFGRGGEAMAIADGCMEEALRRIRVDDTYSGGLLNLGNGSCVINVSGSGSNRIVIVKGTVDNYNKKIEADLSLGGGGKIIINSWKELSF